MDNSRNLSELSIDIVSDGAGNITVAGTFTADGDLIVGGNVTVQGGSVKVGVADTTSGVIDLYGDATGNEGGQVTLYTTGDFDTTYDFFFIDVFQDSLRIGRQGFGTDIILDAAGDVTFGGGITSSGANVFNDSGASPVTIHRNGGTNANTALRFQNLTTSFYIGTDNTGDFAIRYNNADLSTNPAFLIDATSVSLYYSGAEKLSTYNLGVSVPTDGRMGFGDNGEFIFGSNASSLIGVYANGSESARFDATVVAGNTRFWVYDVDNATIERVTVGAANSGGTGYKVLRILN